ncbi:MAG: phosphodiester glycosidase family protein [Bacteroidales bacterium]|jgi:exopolysaccharide biosynthesis protein
MTAKVLLILLSLSGYIAEGQDTTDLNPTQKGTLTCWTEVRSEPRPLRIYYLRADLTCRNLEVFTLTGEDPDGQGPAESSLTLPKDLFEKYKPLAAINANAFAGMPGNENDLRGWYKGRPVDMQGMVVSDGKVISPVQAGRTAFWVDGREHPHIGDPAAGDSVVQAVSDWGSTLVENNKIIPDSTFKTLHPRSALGFDDTGKWILFVVVDGRQPGFSEGISLHELATLFHSHGCTQALNLDGGGSSILLIQKPGNGIQTVNKPSGIMHRPIPVMVGVRKLSEKK